MKEGPQNPVGLFPLKLCHCEPVAEVTGVAISWKIAVSLCAHAMTV